MKWTLGWIVFGLRCCAHSFAPPHPLIPQALLEASPSKGLPRVSNILHILHGSYVSSRCILCHLPTCENCKSRLTAVFSCSRFLDNSPQDTKKIKVDAYTGARKSEEKDEDKVRRCSFQGGFTFYRRVFLAEHQSCFLVACHPTEVQNHILTPPGVVAPVEQNITTPSRHLSNLILT